MWMFILASVFTIRASNAYVYSNKTINTGYESIAINSTMILDDDLINWMNAQFVGLNIPLGSLTFNSTLHRLSEGLRTPRPSPIGREIGFFIAPSTIVLYHQIYGKHLTHPGGEMGELVSVLGLDVNQPYQFMTYTAGTAMLTTNEGIVTTDILVGMADIVYVTGIFEKFTNGHIRVNSMTTLTPSTILNGTIFSCETVYLAKLDSNQNLFWWDSYVWAWW